MQFRDFIEIAKYVQLFIHVLATHLEHVPWLVHDLNLVYTQLCIYMYMYMYMNNHLYRALQCTFGNNVTCKCIYIYTCTHTYVHVHVFSLHVYCFYTIYTLPTCICMYICMYLCVQLGLLNEEHPDDRWATCMYMYSTCIYMYVIMYIIIHVHVHLCIHYTCIYFAFIFICMCMYI